MRHNVIDTGAAEEIAIGVLQSLAADPERLGRFLAASGLTVESLRGAAGSPGFLAGIMDYLAGDEGLLLEVARELRIRPERVLEARRILSGPEPE